MSIYITSSRRHHSQKADWYRRENAETFFDASVHKRQIDQVCNHEVLFRLDGTSDLSLEMIENAWISKQMIYEAT
jgi:hypothetical protein